MLIFITICVVIIATLIISRLTLVAEKLRFSVSKFSYIDSQFKYQLLLLGLAGTVLGIVFLLARENFFTFFNIGNVSAPAQGVSWLGVASGESWLTVGANATAIITLATLVFISLGVWKAKAKPSVILRYLPWITLFSLTNSFAEEIIYRLGVIVPLYGILSVSALSVLSAVLFGLPHYRGVPSGLTGVAMAGVLGWFLTRSVIETQGIGWAWGIHFLQDIVIYSGIVIMVHKKTYNEANESAAQKSPRR